ncbi:MAG: Rieske (2Fe-2S) protein [Streptomyces sp.]|uniref:Rieske (2Fe-2S) protein n=1 Tax=Streptomyces sp. TaxID=1931 RepID=UPI003D6B6448
MTASTTRRSVIAAAGAAGAAVTLAACGSDGGSGDAGGDSDDTGEAKEGGGGAANGELGKAADIPEGGGKIFKEQKVVVTRPSGTEYKAFSATCTHKGCLVTEVADGTINCACHGSKFDVNDGSVTTGPATRGLPLAKVTVKGGTITLAD